MNGRVASLEVKVTEYGLKQSTIDEDGCLIGRQGKDGANRKSVDFLYLEQRDKRPVRQRHHFVFFPSDGSDELMGGMECR